MSPTAVFVYGTLKQGERNFEVSAKAGWLRSEKAFLSGFRLYHIPERERLPYTYPAMIRGEGLVWGEVQWFADLGVALSFLDPLEDEGREYVRVQADAVLGGVPEPHGFEERQLVHVWTYVYPGPDAIQAASGVYLPEGVWREADLEREGELAE